MPCADDATAFGAPSSINVMMSSGRSVAGLSIALCHRKETLTGRVVAGRTAQIGIARSACQRESEAGSGKDGGYSVTEAHCLAHFRVSQADGQFRPSEPFMRTARLNQLMPPRTQQPARPPMVAIAHR